jgi:hypothetical protein
MTRYYMRRRWKISWSRIYQRHRLVRVVKHYERREEVGDPWQLVRSIVQEASGAPRQYPRAAAPPAQEGT